MTTSTANTQTAANRAKLLLLMTLGPKEIGRRIKSAREDRGWSQMELALQANISMSTVHRWEKGKLPAIRELVRLAGVLGVDSSYLVEGAADPPTSDISVLLAEFGRLRERVEENGAKLDELLRGRAQSQ